MERSIVMFGNASWCVTLPKDWMKRYGLQKGDKLSVTEDGDVLLLKANKQVSLKECRLSLEGIDATLIDKIIGGCYKKGYALIHLVCATEEQYEEVQRLLSNKKLDLYERTDRPFPEKRHFPLTVTLAVPSTINETTLLEQITALMKEIYRLNEEFLRFWSVNAWDDIAALVKRDQHINDLSDICRRIINRNPKDGRSTSLYLLVDGLERIGDSYKAIFRVVSETHAAASREMSQAFAELNDLLMHFFQLSTHFDLSTMQAIMRRRAAFSTYKFDNPEVGFHFRAIAERLIDCLSALLVAHV